MVVQYSYDLNTASFKGILKCLLRWRGSVYKMIWKEFILYLIAFYTFQVFYIVLPYDWKRYYLFAVEYCQRFGETIPVTWFLGFYVSTVCGRYFDQYYSLPWVSSLSMPIGSYVQGQDEESRKIRRTLARYANLSYVLVMSAISHPAKKRFPTFSHITKAGLFLGNEQSLLSSLNTFYLKYFVPIVWSLNLAEKARAQKRIKDNHQYTVLCEGLIDFHEKLMRLTLYDFIQIPLIYTQAVTWCVYTFFFSCLLSRQDIDGRTMEAEISFPIFTFMQFFFYVGWLKVAEEMLNPYGEDDNDFETNSLIDFNTKVSYIIVDDIPNDLPPVEKDVYFDKPVVELPYLNKKIKRRKPMLPGTAKMSNIDEHEMEMYHPCNSKLIFEVETMENQSAEELHKKGKIKICTVSATASEEVLDTKKD